MIRLARPLRRGKRCAFLFSLSCDLGFKDCQECVDLSTKYDCSITRAALMKERLNVLAEKIAEKEVTIVEIPDIPFSEEIENEANLSPESPSPRRRRISRAERGA
jgi:hypothetical protein